MHHSDGAGRSGWQVIDGWGSGTVSRATPAQGRVRVLGHRGAADAGRPENTVAAMTAALDQGADGVEVDVRLTADGVLVCAHDPVAHASTRRSMVVAASRANELRRVAMDGGHRLATLAEVLDAVRRPGGPQVVVEVKPTAGVRSAARTARALADVLGAAASTLDLTVSSFDPALLTLVRGTCAGAAVRTALLGSTSTPVAAVVRRAHDDGHDEVHLPLGGLRRAPGAVESARRLGLSVTCWTVNRRRDLEWVRGLRLDGVITDDVPGARVALGTFPTADPDEDVAARAAS